MDINDDQLREIHKRALDILRDEQQSSSVVVLFSDCLKRAMSEKGIPEDKAWDVKVRIELLPKQTQSVIAQKPKWHRIKNDAINPPPHSPLIPEDWKSRAANDK